jgi:hypothetical protein
VGLKHDVAVKADEQAAVASLWRAPSGKVFKMAELGRDVGLA